MLQCCDLRCYSTGMNNGESTSARGYYPQALLSRYVSMFLSCSCMTWKGELPVQVHVVSYYCVWHSPHIVPEHLETRQGFHCCDIDHQLPQTEKMVDTLPMPWFGLPAPEIRSAMLIGGGARNVGRIGGDPAAATTSPTVGTRIL
jgi:hypothetical protein